MSIFNRGGILKQAEEARFKPNIIIQLLIYILIFIITEIVSTIVLLIIKIIELFLSNKDLSFINLFDMNDLYLEMLFVTAIPIFLTIIYCKLLERRSLTSMGFIFKKRSIYNYFIGLIVGFSMFSICVLVAFLLGGLKFNGVMFKMSSLVYLVILLVGFLIQGLSEEVLMRGYLFISLSNAKPLFKNLFINYKIPIAILINSSIFAVLHLSNPGISLLAVLNLILFGVFASLYMLVTNDIWGIAAVHSIWNFVQGGFYGIAVSGVKFKESVLGFNLIENKELINGGAFGIEGSIIETIVSIISILILIFILASKKNKENRENK